MRSFRLPYVVLPLSLIGMALAFISLYHHTALHHGIDLGDSSFCNISATVNCDLVNKSEWSYLLGVPIASYGVWFYAALIIFGVFVRNVQGAARQAVARATLSITFFGLLFSLTLFLVSKFIIQAFCPTCMGMYVVNVLLFIAALVTDRGMRFIPSVLSGIGTILKSPGLFYSSSARTSLTVLMAGICLLSSGYVAYRLPNLILAQLPGSTPQNTPSHTTHTTAPVFPPVNVKEAVEEWKHSAPITLPSAPAQVHDYAKGPENAPIQVIEFSDFECPYCRRLYDGIETLLERYPDQVQISLRHFPIDASCNPQIPNRFHRNACEAAIFALCAGEQGRYWDAVNFLFSLPEFEDHRTPGVVSHAIENGVDALSLDSSAMQECIASGRPKKKIVSDVEQATSANIQGTPFVIVNNRFVKKPTPDVLQGIFDEIVHR